MNVIESNVFKKYVKENFDEASAKIVIDFYVNIVDVPKNKPKDYKSSTERRLLHIKYLFDDYDKDSILSAIKVFKDKLSHGEINNPSMSYFAGFVKNEFNKPKNVKPEFTNSSNSISKTPNKGKFFTPHSPVFIKNNGKSKIIYNYDFKCECGEDVDRDMYECECGASLLWDKWDNTEKF